MSPRAARACAQSPICAADLDRQDTRMQRTDRRANSCQLDRTAADSRSQLPTCTLNAVTRPRRYA